MKRKLDQWNAGSWTAEKEAGLMKRKLDRWKGSWTDEEGAEPMTWRLD
jgi:hypothetical protein